MQHDALITDVNLIHAGKFCVAWIVGHESCSLNIICLRLMHIEAHDFMPDLKVGRVMPIVIDHTTLLFHWRQTKLFFNRSKRLDNSCPLSLTIQLIWTTYSNLIHAGKFLATLQPESYVSRNNYFTKSLIKTEVNFCNIYCRWQFL